MLPVAAAGARTGIIDSCRPAIVLATVVAAVNMLRSGVAVALPPLAEGLRASVYAGLLRTADWLWTVVVGLIALR